MGYNKIIHCGNTIELYEYEKDIIRLKRNKTDGKRDFNDKDLGVDGKDNLSERKFWKRQDNARRAELAFRRIVASNLKGSTRPLLITLTYRENITDLKKAYRDFSAFIQSLRYKYGNQFKYICVPEFQKRGAVHYHALFWGLPEEVFLLERRDRGIAKLWSRGFVFMKETDGSEKLSFYLSKYMAKAFVDPRLRNQKCYVASRNILRPKVMKGISSLGVGIILDQYGVDESAPLVDRTYYTKWLGKGRYRVFRTSDDWSGRNEKYRSSPS